MTIGQWIAAALLLVTIGAGLHEVAAKGESVAGAIDRNTEAIKSQTNRCRPYTPLFP